MQDFSGIWVPLVTPFDARGALDLRALSRLVRHLAGQGVAGFVACGSTGEAAMLSKPEQDAVLACTLAAAQGLPVWMGLSGVQPAAVARRARALAVRHAGGANAIASQVGEGDQSGQSTLSGFLLSAPAYVRPSQAGIVQFLQQVGDASPLPIVAYDVASRTGVRIQAATLLALADHPRIVAVKDCSGDRAAAGEHTSLDP
jgi:4-hydroxy-tetrahydrodipicolinate synthase